MQQRAFLKGFSVGKKTFKVTLKKHESHFLGLCFSIPGLVTAIGQEGFATWEK